MKNNSFTSEILKRLQSVLPKDGDFVPLHAPSFHGKEWRYVKSCLDTGWVSYAGEYVWEFDKRLAAYCGVKHAISVSSGTAALHMALMATGVKEGEEVLMPALTFVAVANAVSYLRGVPHFVDSDQKTLGIDPVKLESYLSTIAEKNNKGECINKTTGKCIAAIVPVHVFGHPCDMDEIERIAAGYNIAVVTDSAESLGTEYKGRPAASCGKISVLSFNGNKTVTTGGGGAVLTDDDDLAVWLRHITTTAKIEHPWRYIHDETGYNVRMPNINAALGCAGMEEVDSILESKRTLAQHYKEVFSDMEDLRFFKEPDFAKSNYWLNALLLDDDRIGDLDTLLRVTNESGIMTRPVWDLMNTLPMYKNCPSMALEAAENLVGRLINIPSGPFLVP